jgi:hypothetical protein
LGGLAAAEALLAPPLLAVVLTVLMAGLVALELAWPTQQGRDTTAMRTSRPRLRRRRSH